MSFGHPLHALIHAPQTTYVGQVLEYADVSWQSEVWAAFYTWLLLAGFVTFPGTFEELVQKNLNDPTLSPTETFILTGIRNIPLLWVACFCSGLGLLGMLWYCWKWKGNYKLLTEKIFKPGLLHALVGVVATLVNVYAAEYHEWSTMSIASISVEAGTAAACGLMWLLYELLLYPSKKEYQKHNGGYFKALAGLGTDGQPIDLESQAVADSSLNPKIAKRLTKRTIERPMTRYSTSRTISSVMVAEKTAPIEPLPEIPKVSAEIAEEPVFVRPELIPMDSEETRVNQ